MDRALTWQRSGFNSIAGREVTLLVLSKHYGLPVLLRAEEKFLFRSIRKPENEPLLPAP